MEKMWKERIVPNLRRYLGICLEGLRKTTKSLRQYNQSPGTGLNPRTPEWEAGVLTTQPWRSAVLLVSVGLQHIICIWRKVLLNTSWKYLRLWKDTEILYYYLTPLFALAICCLTWSLPKFFRLPVVPSCNACSNLNHTSLIREVGQAATLHHSWFGARLGVCLYYVQKRKCSYDWGK
jgi:hypothetical protein